MFGFSKKRSQSVADIAESTMADGKTKGGPYRMPWYTPIVWLVMIFGPAAYLYQDGDTATAIVWATLVMAGWIGSAIGLARPLLYWIVVPIAVVVSKWGGGFIEPIISEWVPDQPMITTAVANGLVFLGVLVLLHLAICRPIFNFIAYRPRLAQWNAGGGFVLFGGKVAILTVLIVTGLAYVDTRPDWKRQLSQQDLGGKMDLGKMVDNVTIATRHSRVKRWIGEPIPWDQIAREIQANLPEMGAGGIGMPGSGMMPPGVPGMANSKELQKATGSFKKLKRLKF